VVVLAEAVAVPGDIVGFLLSALLIAICFLLAFLVMKFGGKSGAKRGSQTGSEAARKIIHIGVSNWFFIYYYCFQTTVWPIVGLAAFAIINFILTLTGAFSAVIGKESTKRSWGVVYYPLSIIVLILFVKWGLGTKVDLGCALLGMGYGDGLAALLGQKFGKTKLTKGSKKTLLGSVTLLLMVAVIVFALKLWLGFGCSFGGCVWWTLALCSLGIGLAASIAEAVTPLGLDNVSVPIVVFLLAGLI
jgi:phytol kinase